ncbi:MAG: TonB-dependent receptor [Deltaproteobacteria bacterium]|nr:TonB-dependent receptor [Deltaproteobacteria bacterium]
MMWLIQAAGAHARAGDVTKNDELKDELDLLREEAPLGVVVAATKVPQARRDAPAQVVVISGEDLRRFGYRTVAEAVRGLAGFFVAPGRDFDQIGARGLALPGDFNTRLLVTLNGHTMNELWNNSSALGEDLGLDIGLVDRIEAVLGPTSSLYGAGAFLGAVHITTKTGADLNWARASVEAASFGVARASATVGKGFGKGFSFLVNAWHLGREGEPLFFPEFASTPTAGFAPALADRTWAFGFLANVKLGDFTLHGKIHTRDQGLAFAPFATEFANPKNAFDERRGFVELRFDRRLLSKGFPATPNIDLSARVYVDTYRYGDTLAYTDGVAPLAERYLFRDLGEADWFGAEARVLVGFGRATRLLVGAEYQDVFNVRSRSFIPTEFYSPLPSDARDQTISTPFRTAAAYLSDEVRPIDGLTIVGGLRFDHNSRFEGALSPSGALIFRLSETARVRFIYGAGFRYPSVYEAYFDDGVDIAANPKLMPERVHAFEAAFEQNLREDLTFRTSGFYSRVENLIQLKTVDIDPAPDAESLRKQFRNTSPLAHLFGGDARLDYVPKYGLRAYASLSIQSTSLDGKNLPNAPLVLGSAGFSAPLVKDRLFAGLELHVVGKRQNADNTGEVAPYALVNFHLLTVKVLEKLSFSARIQNLLDARYGEVPSIERASLSAIPSPRRTFFMRLDAEM